jgi:hypothetical protein
MTAHEAYAISVHVNGLTSEIERYLAAVDVFRSEGCEPRWSSDEGLPAEALLDSVNASRERAAV